MAAEVVGASIDGVAARELAQQETDAMLDMGEINLVDIAREENLLSPLAGPFSAARNQEVFKALLYLMDAEKKKRPNIVDEPDAMRWYYAR